MAGASVTITGIEGLTARLKKIESNIQNAKPLLSEIGKIVRDSVVTNFDLGGRPTKWIPSIRALKDNDKTLIDTGRLQRSINYQVSGKDTVSVGTNVDYAAIHQLGGVIRHPARKRVLNFKIHKGGKNKGRILFAKAKKANYQETVQGKAYDIRIPARPFLMVQESDRIRMKQAVITHLIK